MYLFHVQTNQKIQLNYQYSVLKIGKFTEFNPDQINLIDFPNADIVSRLHLYIYFENNNCIIEDNNSSNGTFLNGNQLIPFQKIILKNKDCLNLGKDGKMTFIFNDDDENSSQNIPLNIAEIPEIEAELIETIEKPIIPQIVPPTHIQLQKQPTNKPKIQFINIEKLKHFNKKTSHFLGIILMVAGFIYFAASTRIGVVFNAYIILLWIAGGYLIFQNKINKQWGFLLIGISLIMMLLTSHIIAFANLLQLIIAFALMGLGYYLYSIGNNSN